MADYMNILNDYNKDWLIAVLSSVGDGVIIADFTGKIQFVNKKACDLLAESMHSILGKSFNEVFRIFTDESDLPIDFLKDDEFIGDIDRGLVRNSYIVLPDGSKRYISAHLNSVTSPTTQMSGYVLVFRDITKFIESERRVIQERDNITQLFNEFPIGMMIINKDLKIQQINQYFLRTYVLKPENIIGKVFGSTFGGNWYFESDDYKDDMTCEYNFGHLKNKVAQFVEEGKVVKNYLSEIKYMHKDQAKSIWMNLSFMTMYRDEGTYYVLTVEDYTTKINHEQQLIAAKKSSLSILDSLPVMIFRMNSRKKCDFINNTFKSYLPINEPEFLETLEKHMAKQSFVKFDKAVNRSLVDQSAFRVDVEMSRSKNDYRHMLCVSKPLYDHDNNFNGLIGIFLDVHDAKMADLLYRQSQKKYYLLFQNMESSIGYYKAIYDMEHNVVDAIILEVNQATYDVFKFKKETSVGKRLSELKALPDLEKQKIITRFDQVLKTGESYQAQEYYMSSMDHWIQVSIYSPEKDCLAMIITDIDYKKKSEIVLLKEKEKSEEANRVKSEFLANMSHEIRTPLNGIVGMIDLTMLDPLNDEQSDNLITAKECVSSLIDIINDVLDFSKIEAGKLSIDTKSFDLRECIDTTMRTHIAHVNEKNLELISDLSRMHQNRLMGDAKRIKQILNNLISNAIKFTERGVIKIDVSQEYEKENPSLIHTTISVTDTGIGIPEGKKSLLFNSFTQIDGSYTRQYGGTGLGLVISKQLIEMMGGTIGFTTSENIGSTFFFTLPLKISEQNEMLDSDQDQEEKLQIDKSILLVEDDRVNQIVMSKMLALEGATVFIASNGLEAIEKSDEMQYDLILMDIQMPEMDGIEATRYIRDKSRHNNHTPIIALTAFALKGDEEIFRASGMDDYISKPVDRLTLKDKMRHHLSVDLEIQKHMMRKESTNQKIERETIDDLLSKVESLKSELMHENYIVMEIIAHQMKVKFEDLNAEELKNIAFKIELEIRKEHIETILELIERLERILKMLYEANDGGSDEKNTNC